MDHHLKRCNRLNTFESGYGVYPCHCGEPPVPIAFLVNQNAFVIDSHLLSRYSFQYSL